MKEKEMKIISGNSNIPLAKAMCAHLNISLTDACITYFSDNEIYVNIKEDVRGHDAIVIQSLSSPVNDHLMELLLLIDALKRSSVRHITAIIPYLAYSRQDRKIMDIQMAISAKVIADMLTGLNIDQIIIVDVHSLQIQGFFGKPIHNLSVASLFYEDFITQLYKRDSLVVVSPDIGGINRARNFSDKIGGELVIIDKKRDQKNINMSNVNHVIGDVKNKNCVIIDDIVDSANTICNAAEALKKAGAQSIIAYITHAIFGKNAIEKIEKSPIKSLIVSNTINLNEKHPKIRVIDISSFLANSIESNHSLASVR